MKGALGTKHHNASESSQFQPIYMEMLYNYILKQQAYTLE